MIIVAKSQIHENYFLMDSEADWGDYGVANDNDLDTEFFLGDSEGKCLENFRAPGAFLSDASAAAGPGTYKTADGVFAAVSGCIQVNTNSGLTSIGGHKTSTQTFNENEGWLGSIIEGRVIKVSPRGVSVDIRVVDGVETDRKLECRGQIRYGVALHNNA